MKKIEIFYPETSIVKFDENGKIIRLEAPEFLQLKKNGCIIIPILVNNDDYVERQVVKHALQLKTFAEKIPGTFASKYGLSSTFIGDAKKDSDFVNFFVEKFVEIPGYAKSWTGTKDDLLNGTGTALVLFPAPMDLAGVPPSVPPGVTNRFREKAQFIKNQKGNYLKADGDIMYIEKKITVFDPSTGKPDLTMGLVSGGHPHIEYIKSKYSGLEIHKDSGDGHGFLLIDKATNPTWIDNSPLPAPNTSAVWKYQAIYLLKGERIGDWCDPVSVTVKGV